MREVIVQLPQSEDTDEILGFSSVYEASCYLLSRMNHDDLKRHYNQVRTAIERRLLHLHQTQKGIRDHAHN